MQTLFLIGLITGSLLAVVALTLLLRKIPAQRSVARFLALYLRFVFAGYAALYGLIALGVGK
jgi:hypothetical protein